MVTPVGASTTSPYSYLTQLLNGSSTSTAPTAITLPTAVTTSTSTAATGTSASTIGLSSLVLSLLQSADQSDNSSTDLLGTTGSVTNLLLAHNAADLVKSAYAAVDKKALDTATTTAAAAPTAPTVPASLTNLLNNTQSTS